MKLKRLTHGRALYVDQDRIWIARGMSFFAIDHNGRRVTSKYRAGTVLQKLLSLCFISRQMLREGYHHMLILKDQSILVTARKKTYIFNQDGTFRNTFTGYLGNKPASQGVCVTPDGTIFFGEYTVNVQHTNDTHLYRSTDNGKTFQCILTFPKTIRHIHFIKYDPYENCIWLGTGDADDEAKLMRSDDNGDTWKTIGEGSQQWRAIGVCFNEESLVWGTDAGSVSDQNHINQMDRKTHKMTSICEVEGPCHGSASFADGRVFISTGVEGGENERDRFARLKEIKGESVIDHFRLKKSLFPYIMQYGVMRFPAGTENTDRVVFTAMGLWKGLETIYTEVQ